jgi:hypothetical protein
MEQKAADCSLLGRCHLQLSEAIGIPLATRTRLPTICTSHPGLEPAVKCFLAGVRHPAGLAQGRPCSGSAQSWPRDQYQEHVTMTAEPPDSPVTKAARRLEVRWISPGQIDSAIAGWFGRFPAGTESREDSYLLDPRLRGLSVKIRGGGALQVKAYRGSLRILEVVARARGLLESRQGWSFLFRPSCGDSGDSPG